MKKVTTCLAIIALLVSASGCGSNNESSETSTNDSSVNSTTSSTNIRQRQLLLQEQLPAIRIQVKHRIETLYWRQQAGLMEVALENSHKPTPHLRR